MKRRYQIQHAIQPLFTTRLLGLIQKWEQKVIDMPGAIRGGERSPQRFNIIAEALNVKGEYPPLPGFPNAVPSIASSVRNIRKSVKDLEKNPSPGKTTITEALLGELRVFARGVGVDEIGFADVPPEWVFQETAVGYGHAIVLVMEMDRDRIDAAPSPETAVMVHQTYDALGRASNKIAHWLRVKGYAAHAGHPLGGMALYPPLAQKAGLGWRGSNGLLITPRFGPRVRLAAVFTEIENLPACESNEHAWVQEYCQRCRRCVHECPSQAIYETPIYHDNQLVTTIDNNKCFPYFVQNYGCSICIKVCPFHHSSYESLKANLDRLHRVAAQKEA